VALLRRVCARRGDGCPAGDPAAYLSLRAVRDGIVSAWIVAGPYLLALAPLVGVARAGATLTAEQLALHALAARSGAWLWGAA